VVAYVRTSKREDPKRATLEHQAAFRKEVKQFENSNIRLSFTELQNYFTSLSDIPRARSLFRSKLWGRRTKELLIWKQL